LQGGKKEQEKLEKKAASIKEENVVKDEREIRKD